MHRETNGKLSIRINIRIIGLFGGFVISLSLSFVVCNNVLNRDEGWRYLEIL